MKTIQKRWFAEATEYLMQGRTKWSCNALKWVIRDEQVRRRDYDWDTPVHVISAYRALYYVEGEHNVRDDCLMALISDLGMNEIEESEFRVLLLLLAGEILHGTRIIPSLPYSDPDEVDVQETMSEWDKDYTVPTPQRPG